MDFHVVFDRMERNLWGKEHANWLPHYDFMFKHYLEWWELILPGEASRERAENWKVNVCLRKIDWNLLGTCLHAKQFKNRNADVIIEVFWCLTHFPYHPVLGILLKILKPDKNFKFVFFAFLTPFWPPYEHIINSQPAKSNFPDKQIDSGKLRFPNGVRYTSIHS